MKTQRQWNNISKVLKNKPNQNKTKKQPKCLPTILFPAIESFQSSGEIKIIWN